MRRELARLPVDQREVLVLRLLDERSYKEIAEITGKKIGTVGWLISVGLKELGQRLGPLMSGEKRPDGRAIGAPPVRFDLVQGEMS